jgi:hypothetical protein
LIDVEHARVANYIKRAGIECRSGIDCGGRVGARGILAADGPAADIDCGGSRVVQLDILTIVGAAVVVDNFIDDHRSAQQRRGTKNRADGCAGDETIH